MEFGAEYTFSDPNQFFAELDDLIAVEPTSSLDDLDYALRNFIAFTSTFLDQYLTAPGALDHALFSLLASPLFTSHVDRMTTIIISYISTSSPPSSLFISLMLVLHLGQSNPLEPSSHLIHAQSTTTSKVFKFLRKDWKNVVPVLIKCVQDAGIVHETSIAQIEAKDLTVGPQDGWGERIGTTATAVLYEVCRVQKLNADELSFFDEAFIEHIFSLVERTRDAEDETFNYTLIKLIIALNEQFMVVSLPSSHSNKDITHGGNGTLPPPILPKIVGKRKEEKEGNLVLEVLKRKEADSKTFGENIIFILNRSNGTPDSLCVSLLILKILYLLFTTSGTHEYFYTNDLCVLVDVFIRELCDLGEESEGLRHTYLRVLHPLLTNTQLRHHPYKRPLLRRVLNSIISNSHYCEVDATTRRLVERNLRGSWCDGLTDESVYEGEKRKMSGGWSSGMGRSPSIDSTSTKFSPKLPSLGLMGNDMTGSTLSVDAVASAEDSSHHHHGNGHGKKGNGIAKRSSSLSSTHSASEIPPSIVLPDQNIRSASPAPIPLSPVSEIPPPTTPSSNGMLLPPRPNRQRSTSLLSPRPRAPATSSILDETSTRSLTPTQGYLQSEEIARSVSTDQPKRRRPPPPPTTATEINRPRTPGSPAKTPTPAGEKRRQAPEPPKFRRGDLVDKVEGLRVSSF